MHKFEKFNTVKNMKKSVGLNLSVENTVSENTVSVPDIFVENVYTDIMRSIIKSTDENLSESLQGAILSGIERVVSKIKCDDKIVINELLMEIKRLTDRKSVV